VISGFRRGVNELSALMGFYTALIISFFTDVSEQSIGPVLNVQAVQSTLRKIPEERRSQSP
jgi:hypothetical protein